jgi:hypothetical protein
MYAIYRYAIYSTRIIERTAGPLPPPVRDFNGRNDTEAKLSKGLNLDKPRFSIFLNTFFRSIRHKGKFAFF